MKKSPGLWTNCQNERSIWVQQNRFGMVWKIRPDSFVSSPLSLKLSCENKCIYLAESIFFLPNKDGYIGYLKCSKNPIISSLISAHPKLFPVLTRWIQSILIQYSIIHSVHFDSISISCPSHMNVGLVPCWTIKTVQSRMYLIWWTSSCQGTRCHKCAVQEYIDLFSETC